MSFTLNDQAVQAVALENSHALLCKETEIYTYVLVGIGVSYLAVALKTIYVLVGVWLSYFAMHESTRTLYHRLIARSLAFRTTHLHCKVARPPTKFVALSVSVYSWFLSSTR